MVSKKIVSTLECKIGAVLAEDVFNYNNIKAVSKNTIINEYIQKKLLELGVFKIRIYEGEQDKEAYNRSVEYKKFKKEYEDIIGSTQKLILNIFIENEVNCNKIIELTNSIYNTVFEADYISKYMSALKDADEYTFIHSVNVAFYSMLIGKWMKMSEDQMKILIQAGILHDIGKMRVDNKILNKPGKLTYEEFQEMKKHTIYGYNIIREKDDIGDNIKKAVISHHERMDGSGYPYGLAGDSINLYARIIAIADTYDAMTSNRVYKKKVTPFKSFDMFLQEGLALYDIEILNVFLNNISTYYIGSNVILNTGEKGKIVYIPPYDILSPIVETENGYLDFSKNSNISIKDVTI